MKKLLCCCIIFSCFNSYAQEKVTDTIYYNDLWKICEQPLAKYYRVGVLLNSDSGAFFSGKVKDYTMNDILLSEGEYSSTGLRNGNFIFYNDNGLVSCKGKYVNHKISGFWKWFYEDGKDRASIYFPGTNEQDFQFVSYTDQTGKLLMDNGVGSFEWPSDAFDQSKNTLTVNGSFDKGKRSGDWEFYGDVGSKQVKLMKEKYANGVFKSGTSYYSFGNSNYSLAKQFSFSPSRLSRMENMLFDIRFKINGDSLAGKTVINYLKTKEPPTVILKNKQFDTVFYAMLRNLHSYYGCFDFRKKAIEAYVEFRVGFRGYAESITFNGNLDSSEKKVVEFVLKKFKQIEMPAIGSVAVETDHRIYIYSLDIREYFPNNMKELLGDELFFTNYAKDEMLRRLEAAKKQIKKYARKHFMPYLN